MGLKKMMQNNVHAVYGGCASLHIHIVAHVLTAQNHAYSWMLEMRCPNSVLRARHYTCVYLIVLCKAIQEALTGSEGTPWTSGWVDGWLLLLLLLLPLSA